MSGWFAAICPGTREQLCLVNSMPATTGPAVAKLRCYCRLPVLVFACTLLAADPFLFPFRSYSPATMGVWESEIRNTLKTERPDRKPILTFMQRSQILVLRTCAVLFLGLVYTESVLLNCGRLEHLHKCRLLDPRRRPPTSLRPEKNQDPKNETL